MSNEKNAPTNASQPKTTSPPHFHGVLRGLDATPSSSQFEGRFGRMFRTLPAAKFFVEDLDALGEELVAEAEDAPTPETDPDGDDEENSGISAGFTYLGQFIDHDLTFDPVSSLEKQNDPDSLTDFRTPRFDLDSVYGRGPNDQPYLYEDDGRHLKLGRHLTGAERFDPNVRDLPRHKSDSNPTGRARALIGDPRNDENVIVAQLHSAMLRFHNGVVDLCGPSASFEEIQQQVRWHYQWVVLHDFLPTIVGLDMVQSILPHLKTKKPITESKPDLRFYKWRNQPFIPVEFSVAAYRFGHSMIRPQYRLNTVMTTGGPEGNGRLPIFTPADGSENLNGFREFPANFAIDWSLFFNMGNNPPASGPERVQPAYKIDSSLVDPLGSLPPSVAVNPSSLAKRNLLRGLRLGLPSGQAVAKQMGIKPISDDKLRVGKATLEDSQENFSITEFGDSFKKNAPLWFYILAEAQQPYNEKHTPQGDKTPIRLGPVGGRIVAEVFIGLMLGDNHSFLRQSPEWKPNTAFTKPDGTFGMAELIKQAIKS